MAFTQLNAQELFYMAAAILFTATAVTVLVSFTFSTLRLTSLRPHHFMVTGEKKESVILVDGLLKEHIVKRGFFGRFYDATSFSSLPKQVTLLLDKWGDIKMAVNDLGILPNVKRVLVANIFIAIGLFLFAKSQGLYADNWMLAAQKLFVDQEWRSISDIQKYAILFSIIMLIANETLAMIYKMKKPPAPECFRNLHRPIAGTVLNGQVVDRYKTTGLISQISMSKKNTNTCVKIDDAYPFSLTLTYQSVPKEQKKTEIGARVKVKVTDQLKALVIE